MYSAVLVEAYRAALAKYPPLLGTSERAPAEARLHAFVHSLLLRILDQDNASCFGSLILREFAEPTPALAAVVEQTFRPIYQLLTSIVAEILAEAAGSAPCRAAWRTGAPRACSGSASSTSTRNRSRSASRRICASSGAPSPSWPITSPSFRWRGSTRRPGAPRSARRRGGRSELHRAQDAHGRSRQVLRPHLRDLLRFVGIDPADLGLHRLDVAHLRADHRRRDRGYLGDRSQGSLRRRHQAAPGHGDPPRARRRRGGLGGAALQEHAPRAPPRRAIPIGDRLRPRRRDARGRPPR